MSREDHPLYTTWKSMRNRCSNPNNKDYRHYGGRGIRVCRRWEDFGVFCRDVGPKPSSAHSLDRIDNRRGYSPGNCRWATQAQQTLNSRRVRLIRANGMCLSVAEWARRTGIHQSTIVHRLNRYGWDPAIAVTTEALQ